MHSVIDFFTSEALVRSLAATWLPDNSGHWHSYDNGKRVTKDPARLPAAAKILLEQIAMLPEVERICGTNIFPDLEYLHGAGLHEMPIGGSLGLHLDSERHPLLPWKREASAVLYLDDTEGGELQLCNERHEVTETIAARFNRLVIFTTPNQWHRVTECRSVRRSLCLFFWSLGEGGKATTATFV